MVSFIDLHRGEYGVEPICKVLPIAPSTYYAHKARAADPARPSVYAAIIVTLAISVIDFTRVEVIGLE